MPGIKSIGASVRRIGETVSEYGSAFEAGATQDLRIEVPSRGGVHLTSTDPKPSRKEGFGTGFANRKLLLAGGLLLAVLFFSRGSVSVPAVG